METTNAATEEIPGEKQTWNIHERYARGRVGWGEASCALRAVDRARATNATGTRALPI